MSSSTVLDTDAPRMPGQARTYGKLQTSVLAPGAILDHMRVGAAGLDPLLPVANGSFGVANSQKQS
jgi:hypothetical protein